MLLQCYRGPKLIKLKVNIINFMTFLKKKTQFHSHISPISPLSNGVWKYSQLSESRSTQNVLATVAGNGRDITTAGVEVVAPHITVVARVSLAVVSSSMASCYMHSLWPGVWLLVSVLGHCWLVPLQPLHYPTLAGLRNNETVLASYTWAWFILAVQ